MERRIIKIRSYWCCYKGIKNWIKIKIRNGRKCRIRIINRCYRIIRIIDVIINGIRNLIVKIKNRWIIKWIRNK